MHYYRETGYIMPPRTPRHIVPGGDDHPRSACSPGRCGEQPVDDQKAPDLAPYSAAWHVGDVE